MSDQQLSQLWEALSGLGDQALADVGVLGFLFLMTVSLVASMFVSYLYLSFYSSRATGSQIHRSFPMLGVSITAIFITIQFSLPLSLGLLGALSIVRFRTPIKEPEEIGFLMLVIASSLACATFNFSVLVILLAIAVAGLLIKERVGFLGSAVDDGLLVLTLPESRYSQLDADVDELVATELRKGQIDSISKDGDEVVISYAFQGLRGDGLSRLRGRLQELVGESSFTILFNRAGTL